MPDLAALVAAAAARLAASGVPDDEASRDAVVLARSILGWSATDWLTRRRETAAADVAERFDALLARRARHEPVAYLTGSREFYGREFVVSPAVLIPRPETELVVEVALGILAARGASLAAGGTGAPAIVDVGTGSGCVAITIAAEAAPGPVIATDVSPAALDVARENARRHGVADRISFLEADLVDGVPRPIDLIVSNPPYVAERDAAALPPDVVRYEPRVALFGGDDGLDVIRRLVVAAADALRPGGWLVMEIGMGQADAVQAIVAATPLHVARIVPDLQAIPRVFVARRNDIGSRKTTSGVVLQET